MEHTYIFLKNVANKQYKTTFTGNIIPHQWYKQFTNKRGTPDFSLISVLAEIVYWYRPKKIKDNDTGHMISVNKFTGDAWQTSYEHFRKKFGFNREKLRRIFFRLESIGICSREFRSVSLKGQTYNNRLFIHLSSDFLNSSIQKKEIIQSKNNKPNLNNSFFVPQKVGGSPHFRGKHIDNKNNINKNRSINISVKHEQHEKSVRKIYALNINKNTKTHIQAKTLKEFYPLTEDDCYKLQTLSGRKFSINSMNEILLDMSRRLLNHSFVSKKSFLNYMGKAFFHEKRDPTKINNNNFRIKRNLQEQQKSKEKEKYLSKIEKSKSYSLECCLKKRLVAKLEQKKAYNLLKAYKSIHIKNETCFIYFLQHIKVNNTEKRIILNELKDLIQNYPENNKKNIRKIKIILPTEDIKKINRKENKKESLLLTSGWEKIREKLVAIYGKATDLNWFSNLKSYTNEEKKIIMLTAPNDFIKYWIEQNYLHSIEKLANQEKFQVSLLSTESKKISQTPIDNI